jgi:hypothetical protein
LKPTVDLARACRVAATVSGHYGQWCQRYICSCQQPIQVHFAGQTVKASENMDRTAICNGIHMLRTAWHIPVTQYSVGLRPGIQHLANPTNTGPAQAHELDTL